MAFKGAAYAVVAQVFQLIDPNGVIAAQFDATVINAPSLQFNHGTALIDPSGITWTDGGQNPASFTINGPQPTSGSSVVPTIDFLANNNGTIDQITVTASALDIRSDAPAVIRDTATNSRGLLYGESFEDTVLGFNQAIPNTGVTLVTLATVNFPIAGGWIDIIATVQAQVAIINDSLTIALLVNGGVVRQDVWVPGPMVVGTQIPIIVHARVAVGTGNQIVRLDSHAITNNAYTANATDTHLSAIFHR